MNTSDRVHWTDNELIIWAKKKLKLKTKYPFIPDKEFEYTGDMEKTMLRILCYKLHLTKKSMINILSKL